jgi:hypothetical protein
VRATFTFVLVKAQKKLVQAVMLLTGIWKVPSAKLGPNTDCPKRFYVNKKKKKKKKNPKYRVYLVVSQSSAAITVVLLVKKSTAAGIRPFLLKFKLRYFVE